MAFNFNTRRLFNSQIGSTQGICILENKYYCEAVPHAGGCCGITNIYNFPYDRFNTPVRIKNAIKQHLKELVSRMSYQNTRTSMWLQGQTRLFEVVLTDRQSSMIPVVEAAGFKKISEFVNINSGNVCYVFHCIPMHGGEE